MSTDMTRSARRAALKGLIAAGENSIDAYEDVIRGASEAERRSLAKVASHDNFFGPGAHVRDRVIPEPVMRCYYFLCVALAAPSALEINDGYTARWAGRAPGSPREGREAQELLAAYARGAASRSDEWLEEVAGISGGSGFWLAHRALLAERGRYATTAASLEFFVRDIVPAPSPSSGQTRRFFEENPTFLEHEFWQLFRVEGALPGSPLVVWVFGEDPANPGGSGDRLHSQDLICYMGVHFPKLRPRILAECLAAQVRDFSAYYARAFSLAWEALEPTREEKLASVPALIGLLGTAPSPSVALAQKALLGLVCDLTDEQAADIVRASEAVLTRTEKKLLHDHLRLLASLVAAHPGCAGAASEVVAAADFPLDLRDRAAALIVAPAGFDSADEAGTGPSGDGSPRASAEGSGLVDIPRRARHGRCARRAYSRGARRQRGGAHRAARPVPGPRRRRGPARAADAHQRRGTDPGGGGQEPARQVLAERAQLEGSQPAVLPRFAPAARCGGARRAGGRAL